MHQAEPIFRSGRFLAGLGLILVTAVGLCLLPLTESLGYEFSLLFSLPASLWAGLLAAGEPGRAREAMGRHPGALRPALVLYLRIAVAVLALCALGLGVILLNTVRVPACDTTEGLAWFALGPIASCLAAAAVGLVWGLVAPWRGAAEAGWVLTWIGATAIAAWEIVTTPAVYAFGLFFGHFAGPLYEELVEIPPAYVSYRACTVVTMFAVIALAHALTDPETLRLRLRAARGSRLFFALLFSLAAVALFLAGPRLGHRTPRERLLEALDRSLQASGIELRFDETLGRDQAGRLLKDARFSVLQAQRFLDIAKPPAVTVFVFPSAEDKKQLIGAGRVSIAKPWQAEVYCNKARFPHPILGHEIVHALSRSIAPAPLHLPRGWLPVPGLVEGLAVAADWPSDDGFTPHAWSRAMLDLGLLPSVTRLMGIAFLGAHQRTSYTAAGSFLRFVHDRYGASRLKALYASADADAVFSKGYRDLEDEWHAFLKGLDAGAGLHDAAMLRFDRPAVIRKRCVHEVAQISRQAWTLARAGCPACGAWRLKRARDLSGQDPWVWVGYVRSLLDAGEDSRAAAEVRRLRNRKGLAQSLTVLLDEIEADVLCRGGHGDKAAVIYHRLLAKAAPDARARTLAAKAASVRLGHRGLALRDYLVGPAGRPALSEGAELLALQRARLEAGDAGLVHYLLARRYLGLDDPEHAYPELKTALSLGLEPDVLRREAVRLSGVALFLGGRVSEASRVFEALASEPGLPGGLKAELDQWIDRAAIWNAL